MYETNNFLVACGKTRFKRLLYTSLNPKNFRYLGVETLIKSRHYSLKIRELGPRVVSIKLEQNVQYKYVI